LKKNVYVFCVLPPLASPAVGTTSSTTGPEQPLTPPRVKGYISCTPTHTSTFSLNICTCRVLLEDSCMHYCYLVADSCESGSQDVSIPLLLFVLLKFQGLFHNLLSSVNFSVLARLRVHGAGGAPRQAQVLSAGKGRGNAAAFLSTGMNSGRTGHSCPRSQHLCLPGGAAGAM
jgi:hypothetical protein